MTLAHSQRGLGFLGWVLVLAGIGFVAMLVIKLVPVYSDYMSIEHAVKEVAQEPGSGSKSAFDLHRQLERFWEIDYISAIQPKDIDVVRDRNGGRALSFDYESRVHLFYNYSLVIEFKGEQPLSAARGGNE